MPLYMAVRYIYCQAIQILWTERKLTKEVIHAICMKYTIPSKGDLYTQIRNTNLRFCQIFVLPYTYCWHFLHLHRWLNYRTLKRKIELIPGLGKIGEHLMRDKIDDVKLIITQKDFFSRCCAPVEHTESFCHWPVRRPDLSGAIYCCLI